MPAAWLLVQPFFCYSITGYGKLRLVNRQSPNLSNFQRLSWGQVTMTCLVSLIPFFSILSGEGSVSKCAEKKDY
jgi:hypothetical protein